MTSVHAGEPRQMVSSAATGVEVSGTTGAVAAGEGRPQCGHAVASVETSRPQSGHAMTGMSRIVGIFRARDHLPASVTIRNDIETRADIDSLMRLFYSRAMSDDAIGYLFTDVAQLDLRHHLPVIGDFWESVLFGSPAYRRHGRSPLLIHAGLDEKELLRPEHFDRWLDLFRSSVDDLFAGPRAEFAKMRSRTIAQRMIEFVTRTRRAREVAALH